MAIAAYRFIVASTLVGTVGPQVKGQLVISTGSMLATPHHLVHLLAALRRRGHDVAVT